MTPKKGKHLSVKVFVDPSVDHLNFAKLTKKLDDNKTLYHFSNH